MHSKEQNEFGQLIVQARKHYNSKLPFVLYREPEKPIVHGIFQQNTDLHEVLDFTEEGFVFAPFNSEKPPILLQPDKKSNALFDTAVTTQTDGNHSDGADREKHLKLVSKGISAIRSGQLRKVVLSRSIRSKTDKDCFALYRSILSAYQTAFCYLWYHPEVGCWLGATPERLLYSKDNMLTTISLAGTRKYKNGQKPIWGVKELEEQQLVTDYLVQAFSKRLEKVQASKPESIKAGNLWHLKSKITGTITADSFSLKALIRDIHPTPAVCGLPKEKAYGFILENEGYDRKFYTGYLGPINVGSPKEISLFVNLRCLQFKEDGIQIYVGGGITGRSLPEDEWMETQHKSQTMFRLL